MTAPRPLPRMDTFSQYQQGKCELPGIDRSIKLSSNENCFGPSPRAVEAFHQAANSLHRYPDGNQAGLRLAIASEYGIDPNLIVCGNGSEEVIGLITRCYLGEGDELLLSENHFVMCRIYGKGQGARIVIAPERNEHTDVDAVLERITPRTRIIALASPNNPTGTYLTRDEVKKLVAGVPSDVLLILDGAYAEYVVASDYDDGMQWVPECSNVVVTRTFSKMYGLAGLRIGWAYGPPEVIEVMNRLRTPFNVSGAGLAAATVAIQDHEHVARTRDHVVIWQEKIRNRLEAAGIRVVPSVANFYLVDFGSREGKSGSGAGAFLEQHGIIPRPGNDERFLRITIGTEAENEAVLETLERYLQS